MFLPHYAPNCHFPQRELENIQATQGKRLAETEANLFASVVSLTASLW